MTKCIGKSLGVVLTVSLLLGSSLVHAQGEESLLENSESVLSLPVFSGNGGIAYTPAIEDLERRGPKSFALDSNGVVYVLDTIDSDIEVLSQVFKNTTWTSMTSGDIGNKSGNHVWMFIQYNKNSQGETTGVYTYEATTDGSEDAAKFLDRTWADAQTYTPMTLK